ncbi:hypothetical protein DWQ65_12980 [Treponema phagedenis]|nr:hypothetical protein FUT79_05960 [Treponema phagedenis]QEK00702.1 hypothetical protein FUT84_05645 [Treponema phagedenis]QEK05711.1 hypothetical protein FUT80_02565 [Treponema phagedenis]QSH95488.1 hypothetical protein C5O78_10765 [Treponema phagedenis]QSI00959.1 hypothetical protein DWQ65_12980 [Treponema phagedenis]
MFSLICLERLNEKIHHREKVVRIFPNVVQRFVINFPVIQIGVSTIGTADLSITMVNCPPLLNSKRCLKASTLFCKIEAFKLVGEVKVNFQNFALAPCQAPFYNRKL